MGSNRTLSFRLESSGKHRLARRWDTRFLAALCLLLGGCFLPPPAEDRPLTGELDAFQVDSTLAAGAESDAVTSSAVGNLEGTASQSGETLVVDQDTVRVGATGASTGSAASGASPGAVDPGSANAAGEEVGTPGAELNPPGSGSPAAGSSGSGLADRDTGAIDAGVEGSSTSVVEVQQSTGTDLKPVADVTDTVVGTPLDFDAQGLERDPDAEPPVGVAAEFIPKEIQSTITGGDPSGDGALAGAAASSGPGQSGSAGAGAVGVVGDQPPPRVEPKLAVRLHTTDDGFVMTYEIGGPPPRAVSTVTPEAGAIDRATLVFIHGWCGNRAQWRSHMEKLSADSIVLSVDLLGHGDSGVQERDEWTIPRYGQDVAGLIEAEDLHDVILVGHAVGTQVALEVALRLPDRITGIIGVESLPELSVDPTEPEDTGLEEYLKAFESDFTSEFSKLISSAAHKDTPRAILDRIRRDAEGCDIGVAIKLMRHFQTRDLKSVARSIECPVRCINSTNAKTDVEGNRALLTNFNATEMEDVGFWPHLEQPESFRTQLVLQIKELQAPKKPRVAATITGLSPVLFGDDIDALAEFYVKSLRFNETGRQPADREQPASLINLERDDWRLQLQSRTSLANDVPGAEDVTQGGHFLFLTVTNIADEKVRLGQDLEVTSRTLDSGSLQLVFRDPQRNVIVLEQPPRRTTAPQE